MTLTNISIGNPGENGFLLPEITDGIIREKQDYRANRKKKRRMDKYRLNEETIDTLPEFIAWDGEGVNLEGDGKPQAYVLFGNSKTGYITIEEGEATITFERLADFMLQTASEYPHSIHVAFSFGYDFNEIVRTLPYRYLRLLNQNGNVKYGKYFIKWLPSKMFTLSNGEESITIYDTFTFYACSFVKALRANFGNDPAYASTIDFIESGKNQRKQFTIEGMKNEIIPYWEAEIRLLAILVTRLRDLLYNSGFRITQFYGPGAIANCVLNQYGINRYMATLPNEVSIAAQYAYAGGRFERFRIGRIKGNVLSADINSAYPDAISKLPNLKNGTWTKRIINKRASEFHYSEINEFSIYHVRAKVQKYSFPFCANQPPAPLFFRTANGEIIYQWLVEGWYWGPEVRNLFHKDFRNDIEIIEGWEFTPADDTKPFEFIKGMYQKRLEWKQAGKPEQMALKLAMNSIYGKLAQRVGYNEIKNEAPKWHQLEWAGWVTSYVRARLWRALYSLFMEYDMRIISVETDGIFFYDCDNHDFPTSTNIGDWTISEYKEIVYLQSGTYFSLSDKWNAKYRGLDANSISLDNVREYFNSIEFTENWPEIPGYTTRFIGLGAAMQWSSDDPKKFRSLHCVWFQDKEKNVNIDRAGKRVHNWRFCLQCQNQISPWDESHFTMIADINAINSNSENARRFSHIHKLPWRNGKDNDYEWRGKKSATEQLFLEIQI